MLKKWLEKRREKKRQKEVGENIEVLNGLFDGDWYYDADSDTYMDKESTRTVTVYGDAE